MRNQDLILKISLNIRLKIDIKNTHVLYSDPRPTKIVCYMRKTITMNGGIMLSNSSFFVCRAYGHISDTDTKLIPKQEGPSPPTLPFTDDHSSRFPRMQKKRMGLIKFSKFGLLLDISWRASAYGRYRAQIMWADTLTGLITSSHALRDDYKPPCPPAFSTKPLLFTHKSPVWPLTWRNHQKGFAPASEDIPLTSSWA